MEHSARQSPSCQRRAFRAGSPKGSSPHVPEMKAARPNILIGSALGDRSRGPIDILGENDMMRLVVGQAVGLAAIGVAIGLVGAFALTRVMSALLFNTNPLDVLTFVSSAAVLLLIAVVSSYLPARRALRIDPTIAMRTE